MSSTLGQRAPEPDGSESGEYWDGIRRTAIDAWNRRADHSGDNADMVTGAAAGAMTVPPHVIGLITRYGNERNDNDPASDETFGRLIRAIRALLAAQPAAPCENCDGQGWIFRGNGEDTECEACIKDEGQTLATADQKGVALPERDASKTAEQQGLFRKFDVRRTDGSDAPGGKHHGCRYFVLDVDHDAHAGAALGAYADACEATHPELARDLREKWGASRRQGVALSDEEIDRIWKAYQFGQISADHTDKQVFAEVLRANFSRASSSRAEVERVPLSEREAFEEWFRRNMNPNATMTRHPDDWPNNPGEYRSIITEDRWKTWLGRADMGMGAIRTARAEKPSLETLNRMAYILRLVPDGETVPGPMLLVLKDQYVAAMRAAQGDE